VLSARPLTARRRLAPSLVSCRAGNPALISFRCFNTFRAYTGAGNSHPGSAGLGRKGDLRPANRYSTFPFKVADPRTFTPNPAHFEPGFR
jgi:hypothetical protein